MKEKVIHPGCLVGKGKNIVIGGDYAIGKNMSGMIDETVQISKKDMAKLKKIMMDTRNTPKKLLQEHPGKFELKDAVKSPQYVNVVYNGLKMGIMKVSATVGFVDKVSIKRKKRAK